MVEILKSAGAVVLDEYSVSLSIHPRTESFSTLQSLQRISIVQMESSLVATDSLTTNVHLHHAGP